MGFRLQRSIKIAPGIRVNLSKSGLGWSVGPRGFKIGATARGQRYTSVSIPGTGVSYRQYERKRPTGAERDIRMPKEVGQANLKTEKTTRPIGLAVAVLVLLYLFAVYFIHR
jgi:Protein of unknown function (DUF4236)